MIKLPSAPPIIGIDPGISGAVARLEHGHLNILRDFKSRRQIGDAIRHLYQPGDRVVIEKVHACPGEGVCSVWTFSAATHTAIASVEALTGESPEEVSPQKWQNAFKLLLGMDKKLRFKEVTRDVATKFFPDQFHYFTRKLDHNSADAALIAAWGVLTGV